MNKIFIISDYDNGYCCSIMANGFLHERYEIRENRVLNAIYKEYDAYDYESCVALIKEHFDVELVIICADGNIEVIEIN